MIKKEITMIVDFYLQYRAKNPFKRTLFVKMFFNEIIFKRLHQETEIRII